MFGSVGNRAATLVAGLLPVAVVAQGQSGSHTDLPRWYGKPYEPRWVLLMIDEYWTRLTVCSSPNYNPGGQLYPPAPSASVLLDVQVAPRHSIYVGSETEGAFIVDAALSRFHGASYINATYDVNGSNTTQPFSTLFFDIRLESTNKPLVASANISINATGVEYSFALTGLAPRPDPYPIVLYGASIDGNQSYRATTELYYLPEKTNGSVTKIDNLHGGLLFRNNHTNNQFEPVFPHGFYTSYGDYLDLSLANVQHYADLGFQVVHPIGDYSSNVTTMLAYMDQINLLFQYDMRGSYQNLTSVAAQVDTVKDFSALLLYYTADEPDGNQDPLNATRLAYNLLAKHDKYHPVSLVLNCANYYFAPYTRGATDVLMVDPYPIGINATFSKWGTACNATYGDCGCDDCRGELSDVSDRLDTIADYQAWLDTYPRKPNWIVPQSFSGEGYWSRDPTPGEIWAMNTLAINHGAKGIVSWTYPTQDDLASAHAEQALVFSHAPVLNFLTGAQPQWLATNGTALVDAAAWQVGSQALVSVTTADYNDIHVDVHVALPFAASAVASTPWGNVTWSLVGGGINGSASVLRTSSLAGLASSLVVLDIAG